MQCEVHLRESPPLGQGLTLAEGSLWTPSLGMFTSEQKGLHRVIKGPITLKSSNDHIQNTCDIINFFITGLNK